MERNKNGAFGIFWKLARIGERLSPYVSICCILMAVSLAREFMRRSDANVLVGQHLHHCVGVYYMQEVVRVLGIARSFGPAIRSLMGE